MVYNRHQVKIEEREVMIDESRYRNIKYSKRLSRLLKFRLHSSDYRPDYKKLELHYKYTNIADMDIYF